MFPYAFLKNKSTCHPFYFFFTVIQGKRASQSAPNKLWTIWKLRGENPYFSGSLENDEILHWWILKKKKSTGKSRKPKERKVIMKKMVLPDFNQQPSFYHKRAAYVI